MEFNNGFNINESQLDRDIRSILDSPESSQGDSDIQRLVSILWEKVGNCNDKSRIENVTTGTGTSNPINNNSVSNTESPITIDNHSTNSNISTIDGNSECSNDVTRDSVFEHNQSIFIHTNTKYDSSNNATQQPTSPSILSDVTTQTIKERPTINKIPFCCKNEAMGKKLMNLSYIEFINQKSEFC